MKSLTLKTIITTHILFYIWLAALHYSEILYGIDDKLGTVIAFLPLLINFIFIVFYTWYIKKLDWSLKRKLVVNFLVVLLTFFVYMAVCSLAGLEAVGWLLVLYGLYITIPVIIVLTSLEVWLNNFFSKIIFVLGLFVIVYITAFEPIMRDLEVERRVVQRVSQNMELLKDPNVDYGTKKDILYIYRTPYGLEDAQINIIKKELPLIERINGCDVLDLKKGFYYGDDFMDFCVLLEGTIEEYKK